MAFSNLQMKTTSEFALQKLMSRMAPVVDFAHNFRELEDRKGASIVIPTFELTDAGEFNATSNNYFGGTNEVDSQTVTLDKHFVKSLSFTDRDMAETEVQFARDGGIAIGDCLGKAIYNYVVGLINTTNITNQEIVTLTAKKAFADLFAVVYKYDMDISETVLMLKPEQFAVLLGTLDANVYGGDEAIRGGRIPGLYGFKSVVCAPCMTAESNCVGALVDRNSIGVAARYLEPMAGAYVESWQASDPVSGLPSGFRVAADLASGVRYIAGEAIVGAKVIRPDGVVFLKSA